MKSSLGYLLTLTTHILKLLVEFLMNTLCIRTYICLSRDADVRERKKSWILAQREED